LFVEEFFSRKVLMDTRQKRSVGYCRLMLWCLQQSDCYRMQSNPGKWRILKLWRLVFLWWGTYRLGQGHNCAQRHWGPGEQITHYLGWHNLQDALSYIPRCWSKASSKHENKWICNITWNSVAIERWGCFGCAQHLAPKWCIGTHLPLCRGFPGASD
jgi:hypothetical protein